MNRTIIDIATSVILTVFIICGLITNQQGRIDAVAAKADAGHWMADTTQKLTEINGKLERLTADTIALSMDIDGMADRMEEAGI